MKIKIDGKFVNKKEKLLEDKGLTYKFEERQNFVSRLLEFFNALGSKSSAVNLTF